MRSLKVLIPTLLVGAIAMVFLAADHIDAPAVSGTSTDIADYYAFQSEENNSNLVFVATSQGLTSPMSTVDAAFDENVLFEFNIDNTGDNIEDLVIQVIPRDGKMYAFGPYTPSSTGLMSTIDESQETISVDITEYGENAVVASTSQGYKLFAGPRDDPFFFDLGQYTEIIAGNATSFNDPGTDALAGTNVMAVVIEVPKSDLGNAGVLNTWVETKSKQ
ncbi:MAG: DUF4331 family protein [Saprospiraceae bacterium]|nr:DUF4331 family protein [Saprospiraceae bacterium]